MKDTLDSVEKKRKLLVEVNAFICRTVGSAAVSLSRDEIDEFEEGRTLVIRPRKGSNVQSLRRQKKKSVQLYVLPGTRSQVETQSLIQQINVAEITAALEREDIGARETVRS